MIWPTKKVTDFLIIIVGARFFPTPPPPNIVKIRPSVRPLPRFAPQWEKEILKILKNEDRFEILG